MLNLLCPRLVVIYRKTPLQLLIEQHGTLSQARFYLESRSQKQTLDWYEEIHERFETALSRVAGAIPSDQRWTKVDRHGLDRFLFSPDDIVTIVGQDGLVANVAKYLNGQVALGINPAPERYDGVLCRHSAEDFAEILKWIGNGKAGPFHVQQRVMALAEREDGQKLPALNEIFVGHRTHQSARYRIRAGSEEERQSSSGVICSTGTGCTGWARSIARQRGIENELPEPEEPKLVWFVREPFPSVATATDLDFGHLGPGRQLKVFSEMGEEGVVFADGIESDFLEFRDGHHVTIRIAPQTLNLVVPIE